jgi:7,8-dihydropterin-6-yl-methyl-4-(beta-D-ribofuranosyl)aminobenzene 5'-phosphate synthase
VSTRSKAFPDVDEKRRAEYGALLTEEIADLLSSHSRIAIAQPSGWTSPQTSVPDMHLRPLFTLFCLVAASAFSAELAPSKQVQSLRITILSTMLADGKGIGEWGFAALVEADGHRLLFDTGNHTDVVLRNAEALELDLTTVPDVVLSHSHSDHTGGFLAVRRAVAGQNPAALARTFVGEGIFQARADSRNAPQQTLMLDAKRDYEASGGTFEVCTGPREIFAGVWLTGPVPRKYPERNWSGQGVIITPGGRIEDTLPEDMALVCDTAQGLVILTGCGHAGVMNIIEHARNVVRAAPVHALIGGIHLFRASETTLDQTAGKLREFGVANLIGAHCTGLEVVYRFRRDLALDRAHAVVGAVGASFVLGEGIKPGDLAK